MAFDDHGRRHRKQRAFFGRRKGHPLRAAPGGVVRDAAADACARSHERPRRPICARCLQRRSMIVRLEIGFGGGEHLIAQAQAHPRTGFIGTEPSSTAWPRRWPRSTRTRWRTSACISATPANCSTGCPMQRSRASICSIPIRGRSGGTGSGASCRTTASPRLARILQTGGEFRFATRHRRTTPPGRWRVCMRSPDFVWTAERADDWRKPWPDFAGTRYEAKAKREGRAPAISSFRRAYDLIAA